MIEENQPMTDKYMGVDASMLTEKDKMMIKPCEKTQSESYYSCLNCCGSIPKCCCICCAPCGCGPRRAAAPHHGCAAPPTIPPAGSRGAPEQSWGPNHGRRAPTTWSAPMTCAATASCSAQWSSRRRRLSPAASLARRGRQNRHYASPRSVLY